MCSKKSRMLQLLFVINSIANSVLKISHAKRCFHAVYSEFKKESCFLIIQILGFLVDYEHRFENRPLS